MSERNVLRFGVVQFLKHHMWIWIDFRAFRFWYVLIWTRGRGSRPYLYRSTDATPPCERNFGRWIFGRKYGSWNA